MTDAERDRFDALLEQIMSDLPAELREYLEITPVVVEDFPDPQLLLDMGMGRDDTLCGLHWGTPLTERSVEDPAELPESIYLFRTGIIELAGGWDETVADTGRSTGGVDEIRHEIHTTLLHEIGHHFGLDEEDLDRLGYA